MTPIDYDLDEHHLQVSVSAGHDPSFRTGVTPIDHFDKVKEYNPQVSASAGTNSSFRAGVTPIDYDLDEHHPQVSVTAGHNSSYRSGTTPIDYDLDYTNPQVSAHAGYKSSYKAGLTPIERHLDYTNPQVSAHAGSSSLYREGIRPVDYHLDNKTTPISVGSGMNTPMQSKMEGKNEDPRGDKIHPAVFIRPGIRSARPMDGWPRDRSNTAIIRISLMYLRPRVRSRRGMCRLIAPEFNKRYREVLLLFEE